MDICELEANLSTQWVVDQEGLYNDTMRPSLYKIGENNIN